MKLIHSPHPFLQKQVKPFDFEHLDAKSIAEEMIDIMVQSNGIGLSANQVELDAQIFVMSPQLLETKNPLTIINPEILSVAVNVIDSDEGCLSHPDLWLKIKRPRGIIVKYLDIDAKECKLELYDIDARCFLHEFDHLQGIEYTDRVSKLRLSLAKKKQKKKIKRNFKNG